MQNLHHQQYFLNPILLRKALTAEPVQLQKLLEGLRAFGVQGLGFRV